MTKSKIKTKPISIFIIILATLSASFSQLLFKFGSEIQLKLFFEKLLNQSNIITLNNLFSDSIISPAVFILIGFMLYGISAVLLVVALKHGELSVIYPIFAANYIWVAILSLYFLKEIISLEKWIGIGAIVIGISLIGYGGSRAEEDVIPTIERFGIQGEGFK